MNVNVDSGAAADSYFDGGLLQLIGCSILGFLVTALTLGIYGFWVGISLKKWRVKHTRFA